MTSDQRKLFAEILQKELNKVFEKHIEDLKSAYVSQDPPYILSCTKGEKENEECSIRV